MKKIIIISILLNLVLVSLLFGEYFQNRVAEDVMMMEQTHMNQFPDPWSDLLLDPMINFPAY